MNNPYLGHNSSLRIEYDRFLICVEVEGRSVFDTIYFNCVNNSCKSP